jgi:hypothetical protein
MKPTALLAACHGGGPDTVDTDGDADADTDTDTDTDADSDADTGPAAPDVCGDLGLPTAPFSEGPYATELRGIAGDFTVQTPAGAWSFRENFSGCDTILFIPSQPRQATGWPYDLWERDVDDLLEQLPKNVHLFFASSAIGADDVAAELYELEDEVTDALAQASGEDRAHWEPRTHYATESVSDLDGWIGDYLADPNWGFAIDREQRIRDLGSLADVDRYSSAYGWFQPNLSYAANELLEETMIVLLPVALAAPAPETLRALWARDLPSTSRPRSSPATAPPSREAIRSPGGSTPPTATTPWARSGWTSRSPPPGSPFRTRRTVRWATRCATSGSTPPPPNASCIRSCRCLGRWPTATGSASSARTAPCSPRRTAGCGSAAGPSATLQRRHSPTPTRSG